MRADAITIERVQAPSDDVIRELADVLVDAVAGGSSVSFMAGLTTEDAADWWRRTLDASTARSVVLVARDDSGIVGTVQLQPAWAPNQPHRADVAKLLVHRRARRRGVARMLMRELEERAREEHFTLLVLDTCRGTAAEQLYSSMGWIRVGEIPRFALNPDGTPCDTVFFYREL